MKTNEQYITEIKTALERANSRLSEVERQNEFGRWDGTEAGKRFLIDGTLIKLLGDLTKVQQTVNEMLWTHNRDSYHSQLDPIRVREVN